LNREPIAIIGIGCRFPGGAHGPEAFWRLLSSGIDAVKEIPSDRWNVEAYYDPIPGRSGKSITRWGGFIDQIDRFDAAFFGLSPREAAFMDPQQRILLETAWEALEDGGQVPASLRGSSTGVFVGISTHDYELLQSSPDERTDIDIYSTTGGVLSIAANRISYCLDLHGPSLAVDTACSSSLVAVHLACESLWNGTSSLALVGGVNALLAPMPFVAFSRMSMMSPTGRCRAFDAAADGFVRGEGAGVVVLKRFSAARKDGDRVYAVIRGTAANQDGRTNGLTLPSAAAQAALVRAACRSAGVDPASICYVEAHGTGTPIGDPIEARALGEALGVGRSTAAPCIVGSVKTNIGHLESAAGIAGLIKLVLMLRHGQIPAHLHLKTVNPMLRLEDAPMEIPTTMRDWPRGAAPRRGGVSAFGFGGTNAHVILEEPPAVEKPEGAARPRHVLSLSARSPQALSELAARYADCVDAEDAASLADLAHTANTGREHFDHRAAVVAASCAELRQRLQAFALDPLAAGVYSGHLQSDRPPKIAFLFTGQGAQYAGMGRALYETQPTFRSAIEACAELLRPHLDRPLLSLLDPEAGSLLDQTGYTQPVMFSIEYALAKLWQSWGLEPAAVMGHSVGEFAAACISGVFSLEDGLRLIAQRARLMQSLPAGGLMAAVFATEARVIAALEPFVGHVTIAAFNGPQSIVISGDEPAVREVLSQLATAGIKSKILATSHAFHSQRMDPILGELRDVAAAVTYAAPKIDIIANLTGRAADPSTYAAPDYWSRHARQPVRFAESMQALADCGCEMFLEIGPSPTLIGMGRHCLPEGPWAWLPSLRPGRDDWQTLLESVSQFYARGAKIDWAGFDRDYRPRKTSLPAYPFQRRRYWTSAADAAADSPSSPRRGGRLLHPLLGRRVVRLTAFGGIDATGVSQGSCAPSNR
jgi:acyl transferase domain-containing protein